MYFHELNEKRKGAPYGMDGGGYIYKERTWRELLSDEFRGREGKQQEYLSLKGEMGELGMTRNRLILCQEIRGKILCNFNGAFGGIA